MSPDDQLLYETRVRNRQAVVAAVAGVFLIAAAVVQLGGAHTKVDELTLDLITANKRFPLDIVAAVLNGIASLAIAWTLTFLYRCARARGQGVKPFIKVVAIAGGVLAAVTGIVYAIIVSIKVHDFVTQGAQTYDQASHLTSGPGLLALQLLGQAAALLLAVAFVLVSLQAMRQGLLTRFMGYLGIFAGALVLFQITQVPVVQFYWLLAVAYLISGRWPTGVPLAWRTGRAETLPSSAQVRQRRAAGGGSGRGAGGGGLGGGGRGGGSGGLGGFGGLFKPNPKPAPAPQPASPSGNGRTRATTSKRKRKRRS